MKNYQAMGISESTMGVIDAAAIVEYALGEVITGAIGWGEDVMPHLRAEEILNHALRYLEEQIPEYLRVGYNNE